MLTADWWVWGLIIKPPGGVMSCWRPAGCNGSATKVGIVVQHGMSHRAWPRTGRLMRSRVTTGGN